MTCVPGQKWPNQLVLVRHATSLRNEAKAQPDVADFSCGMKDSESPLSQRGINQALAVGAWFKGAWNFDAVYASPYVRCRETAKIIRGTLGISAPILTDDRLREIEFGYWDGLSKKEIARRHPLMYQRQERDGKFAFRNPGGESWFDVAQRLRSFVSTLVRETAGKRVMVVAHSVTILLLRYLLERLPEQEILKIDKEEDLHNCSVTEYRFDPTEGSAGKLILKQYNSVYYYEKDCFNEAAKQRRNLTLQSWEKANAAGATAQASGMNEPKPPRLNSDETHPVVYEARNLPLDVVEAAVRLARKKNNCGEYVHQLVAQLGDSPSLVKLARDLAHYVLKQDDNDKRLLTSMACLATAFAAGMEASEMLVCGNRKPQ